MHIENMENMIESLTSCVKQALERGDTSVGCMPITEAVDMVKDLSEAVHFSYISKAMKHAEEEDKEEEKYLLQKMKEEYGDEAERYYNEYRYSDGRYAPKGRGTRRGYHDRRYVPDMMEYEPEYYRDMDRDRGKMYYTEPTSVPSVVHESSRLDTAIRNYHESTTKDSKMRELDHVLSELESMAKSDVAGMSAEEKQMLKSKLTKIGALVP